MTRKIAIISLYNPDKWSWAEKVTKEIGEKLAEEHEVSFIFTGNHTETVKKWKITYISIKTPNFLWFNFFFFIFKLKKFLKQYEIDILIDNMWASAWYLLFHKKKFTLISIIHWATKSLIKYATYIKFNNIIEKTKYYCFLRLNNIASKYVLKKSDLVITLSKYLLHELIEYYGLNKEKIRVIYNWYDPILLSSPTDKKHEWLKVLFISNDHARKGIKILEETAQQLSKKNIVFYIIGNEYNSTQINIKALWKLERKTLYELMWTADVIFLPSYYEWQPLVILEAMSFGCIPVISQKCHMDMLEDTIFNKFINQNNDSKTYIAMFNSLVHEESLTMLHNQAQEVIKKYDRNTQAQKYLDIINML